MYRHSYINFIIVKISHTLKNIFCKYIKKNNVVINSNSRFESHYVIKIIRFLKVLFYP